MTGEVLPPATMSGISKERYYDEDPGDKWKPWPTFFDQFMEGMRTAAWHFKHMVWTVEDQIGEGEQARLLDACAGAWAIAY